MPSPPPSDADSRDLLTRTFLESSEDESAGARRNTQAPETQQAMRAPARITSIDYERGLVNMELIGSASVATTDRVLGRGFIDAFDLRARETVSRAREQQRAASARLGQGGLMAPLPARRQDPSPATQSESQDESRSRGRSGVPYQERNGSTSAAQMTSSGEESHSQSDALPEEQSERSHRRSSSSSPHREFSVAPLDRPRW